MKAPVQDVMVAQLAVLLTAITIVAFWRPMVRWLMLLASTAVIATLGLGLIQVWQVVHHTAV
jgi:hypothetical protein